MKNIFGISILMIFVLQVGFSKMAIAEGKFAHIDVLYKITMQTQAEATQAGIVEWAEKNWKENFPSDADVAYFEKLRLRLVQNKNTISGLKIIQEKDSVVIINDQIAPVRLTVDPKMPGSLYVNGVQINAGEYKSGKALFEKIAKIIDVPKKKNAWLSLFLPDAHAVVQLVVYGIGLGVAVIGVKIWGKYRNEIPERLNALKKACEKQKLDLPYDGSETQKAYDLLVADPAKYSDYKKKFEAIMPQIKDELLECLSLRAKVSPEICQLLRDSIVCHDKFRKSKGQSGNGETSSEAAQ